jgi:hypothetical protein
MSKPVEHNIEAFYSLSVERTYWPALSCSCGFKSCEKSWEETGIGMDSHLSTTEQGAR